MDFDYSTPPTVKVSIIKYATLCLDDFPEIITSTSSSPAADHLFTVRYGGEAKLLPEEQAQQFHHSVAQLLFLCMRALPDLQTAISFLTKRVKNPDEDDWGKLKRVLKYLKGTLHMKLVLTVDNMTTIRW